MDKIDELQNLVNRHCDRMSRMADFEKTVANRILAESNESNKVPNTIQAKVEVTEQQPLTAQQIYVIAQDSKQWQQFLEAKKPELEAGWGRRSA